MFINPMDTMRLHTTSSSIYLGMSSMHLILQPTKILQHLLGRFPQFVRQVFPLCILARLFKGTEWHQILPLVLITLFKDLT